MILSHAELTENNAGQLLQTPKAPGREGLSLDEIRAQRESFRSRFHRRINLKYCNLIYII